MLRFLVKGDEVIKVEEMTVLFNEYRGREEEMKKEGLKIVTPQEHAERDMVPTSYSRPIEYF